MRLLALDTTTEACSAAVLTEGGIFGVFEEVGRGHAEVILGMVDAVLSEAGLKLGMLDAIAAGVGPGAFSGVRISVSVAQGLAFGAQLPVVAVTTLEALAFAAVQAGAERAVACLDARMREVYWGCYRADAERGLSMCGAPAVSPPAGVSVPFSGTFHGIGRGFAAHPALKAMTGLILSGNASTALPDARDVARLGALRFGAGEGMDAAGLTPVYLRDRVALTEAERAAAKQEAV